MAKQDLMMELAAARHQPKVFMYTLPDLGQAPKDRQEKIKSLTKAVRANSYRIDCRKLADCLIGSLLLGLMR